jgi:DNA-directed RNA polymerase subunit M/transcription elongation factor TFIIS
MAIRFSCQCGQELQARDAHVGRKTRCPRCGAEQIIPDSTAEKIQSHPETPAQAGRQEVSEEDENVQAHPNAPPRARRRDSADENDFEEWRDRPGPSGTSGKAWASLVLGFLSFGCNVLTGIPAIILAIMSFGDISRSRGRLKGHGVAIAAIVVSVIGMLAAGPVALFYAVYKVRDAAARMQSANNLKQIGLAFHNHNDTFQSLPPGNFQVAGPNAPKTANYGKPGLSWRVALLPYLEEDALYRQFHLNEPWDSPHNITLLTRMPKVYAHPAADKAKTASGFTHYRAFTGPHTLFDPTLPGGARIPASFPDGTATTIFVVEAADPVEWTKPDDLPFEVGRPLPKLGAFYADGSSLALMGDASVHRVDRSTSEITLRAAITRDGGELLGSDW